MVHGNEGVGANGEILPISSSVRNIWSNLLKYLYSGLYFKICDLYWKILNYFPNLVEILRLSYYMCSGVILDPELSRELLSTYTWSHTTEMIFFWNRVNMEKIIVSGVRAMTGGQATNIYSTIHHLSHVTSCASRGYAINKKCNLTLTMSPSCQSENTKPICWHEFFWEHKDMDMYTWLSWSLNG